jgi:RHS repeat-associated protein
MNGLAGPVLSESAISNIHGQQVDHAMMSGGHRDYSYDGTGRLTSVADLDGGSCAVRAYRFDVNSNRIGHTATNAPATSDASGDLTVCPNPVPPPPSSVFDSGDRIIDAGYAYDEFGRTTRLPMSDGKVMRVEYNADDLVAAQHVYANAQDADAAGGGTNAISTSTYTLDATGQRFATRSASSQDGTSITRTLRYDDDSDSPAWTDEGDGTMRRYIHGPGGGLAATASIDKANPSGGATLVWQIANMHGDISATLPASASMAIQISRPDEYGAGTEQPRYGWLGSQQRAGDTPAGAYLMGVRLYNANTGRFLSTDSVYGGNANAYAYPTDPVGDLDLDGRASYPKYSWALCHWWQIGCGASRKAYAAALGWGKEKQARRFGARCFSEGGLRICEDTPRWVGAFNTGTTWGTTFLVAAQLPKDKGRRARLIQHEREHVRQWQLFGVKFAYLYALEGFEPCGNYFESKAGHANGGYTWC